MRFAREQSATWSEPLQVVAEIRNFAVDRRTTDRPDSLPDRRREDAAPSPEEPSATIHGNRSPHF
ncbi:hypothetical protein J7S33_04285, partial [Saccharothrix algeriensis]